MAKKKTSYLPKNDFALEEELDVCGFTDEPVIEGECISLFSFDDGSMNDDDSSHSTVATSIIRTSSDKKDILTDNKKAPIIKGCTPPIDGECLDVKRTYMLRNSTVRKLNELKSIHPDLNTYVSSIVDMAISHYHNHIINEGGTQ